MTKQDAVNKAKRAYPNKNWTVCMTSEQPGSFDVFDVDDGGYLAIVDELGVSLLKVIDNKEFV
jgi:hypothetical protein